MDRHETSRSAAHEEVAAYALGVLDPEETIRYERHLARCPECARELEELLPVSRLLAQVDPEWLAEPEPALATTTTATTTTTRATATATVTATLAKARPARRFRFALVPAAALAGVTLFAGGTLLAAAPEDRGGVTPPLAESPVTGVGGLGGSDLEQPEVLSAVDPATGVAAEVTLSDLEWGTSVAFTLSAVSGPRDCQLVLEYADGSTELAGSWWVPPEGYGVPGQPEPLELTAGVAGPRQELVALRVEQLAPDGSVRTLVRVSL